MPRGDANNARKNILKLAEDLFSEKGFNATSINLIAEKAGVNKALIYYYFQDKDDIVNSLFEMIIQESEAYANQAHKEDFQEGKGPEILDEIREEIRFMQNKKKILAIMLMESLKGDDRQNYLFQCAEKVINNEREEAVIPQGDSKLIAAEQQRFLVNEFFTGFIPMMVFSIFKDKWCEYYQCDKEQIMEYFLDAFMKTHLTSNKPDGGDR